MKKTIFWIAGAVAVLGLAAQFFQPARTNPSATPGGSLLAGVSAPPPPVAAALRAACYDCHSSETQWPWYSHVAPMSWLVVGHVNEGRHHLNFSEWPADPVRAQKKLGHISEAVDSGDMPLKSYTFIHAEARLAAEDRRQIAEWAEQAADRLKAASAKPEK